MANNTNNHIHESIVIKVDGETLTGVAAFKMVQKINDHVRVGFTAAIADEKVAEYKAKDQNNLKISLQVSIRSVAQSLPGVNTKTPSDRLVFAGIVTKLEVIDNNNDYQIKVAAASHTYNLDVRRRRRSFKDKQLKYSELVGYFDQANQTLQAKGNFVADQKALLQKFFLQYEETDWEFLIRMASQLNIGLVAAATADAPHYDFGVSTVKPTDGLFENCNFTISKDNWRYNKERKLNPELKSEDYLIYAVNDSRKSLPVGAEVTLNGRTLYVCQATLELQGGSIYYHYRFTSQTGLWQPLLTNSLIQGSAITGKVTECQRDQVKLAFDFDQNSDNSKDCLFPVVTPYSGEGHTGWYVMPEVNDQVKLYFPDNCEDHAYVTTTVRQNGLPDDVELNAQYLRTKFNQQMMAGSKGIRFTTARGKDGGANLLLRVHADLGVQIISDQNIEINAAADLLIKTQSTATFKAANELQLVAKTDNQVTLQKTKIACKGAYLNQMPKTLATTPELQADLEGIIFTPTAVTSQSGEAKPEPAKPKDDESKGDEGKENTDDEEWIDPLKTMKVRRNSKSNTFGKDVRKNGDGSTRPHQGVDLFAPIGTDTFAVMKGKVYSIIDTDQGDYGKKIILEFKKSNVTYYAQYAHLSTISVKKDEQVKAGQIIGKTGDTGNAKKACPLAEDKHLHFEINKTSTFSLGIGTRIDPMPFFKAKMEVK